MATTGDNAADADGGDHAAMLMDGNEDATLRHDDAISDDAGMQVDGDEIIDGDATQVDGDEIIDGVNDDDGRCADS